MLSNHYLSIFKHVFLMLFISIFVIACDKGAEDPKEAEAEPVVPTLNDENIKSFVIKMAEDYNAKRDSLLASFNKAKGDDHVYEFVNFRNNKWTPAYIKQKDYYQSVLAQNSAYLATSSTRPLFDVYENLIYIGIGLKNALLDNDETLLQAQLVEIQKDKETISRTVK